MTYIERLRKGEFVMQNDCTHEEMQEIVRVVWPATKSITLDEIIKYLFDDSCIGVKGRGKYWVQMYEWEETNTVISSKLILSEIRKPKRGKKIGLKELAKMAYDEMPNEFRAHQLADKCRELDFTRKHSYIDTFMRYVRDLRLRGIINYDVLSKKDSLYKKKL
ncbi:hypothetical protein EP331_00305 [bacterium]|nr:MAG: hypothetical protein EP331_00305 [bacterium]